VNLPSGDYDYEWIHPYNGTHSSGSFTHSGGNKSWTPPFSGDAAIYIYQGGMPVALIDADPTIGLAPLSVTFDGSNSYDTNGGSIVSYQWDFDNDGNYDASGSVVSHTYDVVDTYSAKLTVTDNDSLMDSTMVTITVVYSKGDFDNDGDVDQEDFGHFQDCMTGNGNSQNDPLCLNARLDIDDDVDANDFALFEECMTGANMPQTDPACVPS